MCMGLIPEWDAMLQGVVIGVIGVAVLLIMVLVRRRMDGKPVIVFNAKTVGTALLGTAGAIVFGVGMCMTMNTRSSVPALSSGLSASCCCSV